VFAQNAEIKANYVERVIKTIKSKMYRYFTHAQSYNYIEELQKFAASYNKTYHRTIGMPPNKVTKGKETNLWWNMYWPKKVSTKSKSKTIK
jgi:ribulose bisphosphate carboxylase small subunit